MNHKTLMTAVVLLVIVGIFILAFANKTTDVENPPNETTAEQGAPANTSEAQASPISDISSQAEAQETVANPLEDAYVNPFE